MQNISQNGASGSRFLTWDTLVLGYENFQEIYLGIFSTLESE